MDILYSGNVDGFCIVASDSDFTKLVLRLRESGMTVIGMGERKTPNAFVSACETFKFMDILLNDENPSQNPSLPQTRKESDVDGSRKEARRKRSECSQQYSESCRRWRKRSSQSSTRMRTTMAGWIYRSWETIFQSVCRDLTREIINARS
ncbi:MAG: NYN domain-containing protein [Clostridium fessum]